MAFLNTYKTSEHSRYDAAHELGHLTLHRHATRMAEKQNAKQICLRRHF